ncbi:MAG: GNAT family N-acetyltransferase [Flavobacteriaceae bacterium]|nr:GNAT family N-acetyltransferase [Flavobacteriaceae bacterium]
MPSHSKIKTGLANFRSISQQEIIYVAELINRVYMISEHDFWSQTGEYSRTTLEAITEFIKKEELLIARMNNEIVGAVHVYRITDTRCGFGMLVSLPEKRRSGIGAALIAAVETWAFENKYSQIQLELLVPESYKHPDKEFLKKWYTRLGYQLKSATPYADLYPKQAHLLKMQCFFEIYQKNLQK